MKKAVKILFALALVLSLLFPTAISEEILTPVEAEVTEEAPVEEGLETADAAVEVGEPAGEAEALGDVALAEALDEEELAEENRVRVVNVPVDSFPAKLTLGVKEAFTLNAAERLGATGAITYTTSNKKVVTVNKKTGAIKAKKTGSAKITAKWNGKKVVCKVTVKKAPKKVTFSPKQLTLALDDIKPLKVKLTAKSASFQRTFTSDNPAVADVDNQGNVYAMGLGTATITVTTFNNKTDTCTVTVVEHLEPDSNLADFVIENGVVTGYVGAGGAVILPAQDADGVAVTAIGAEAFRDNGSITSIFIPSSVTEIGDSAFENCAALESVTLNNSTSRIGKAAFKRCSSLKTMKAVG